MSMLTGDAFDAVNGIKLILEHDLQQLMLVLIQLLHQVLIGVRQEPLK
jgi:hypothetical protein